VHGGDHLNLLHGIEAEPPGDPAPDDLQDELCCPLWLILLDEVEVALLLPLSVFVKVVVASSVPSRLAA
jgi:hypothetical protein